MPPIIVRDANGDPRELEVPNANGRQNAAGSRPVALSTEDKAALDDIAGAIGNLSPGGGSGGDASAAHQVTQIGLLENIEAALDGTLTMEGAVSVSGTVPVSGPLTDAQLREAPLAVSGDFYPETQPVSGSVSVSGDVAVTGPITDAQLREAPIPVDVSFPATQTVAGEVSIDGTVPVSAEALPLPSGAATSEKQDAAKASLDKLSSAKSWFAITPADNALPTVPDAIYVGGDGDLVLRGADDEDATFAVVAGQILPVSPAQVRAATTATGLVGLVA